MSDELKHIDVDSEEFEDAPKGLRDYARKLQAQNKNLRTERDDARGLVASRAVADVLSDKGFKNPERVKRDILADNIDPADTVAVEKWLSENSDDYARAEGAAQQQAEEKPKEDAVPPEVQLGYQNLTVPGTPASNTVKAVFDQITPEMTGKDVIALYQQHGI